MTIMISRTLNTRPLAYRVDEAARLVGVSKSKMWEFIKRGDLRTFKLDGSTLIRHEAIEDLLTRAENGQVIYQANNNPPNPA